MHRGLLSRQLVPYSSHQSQRPKKKNHPRHSATPVESSYKLVKGDLAEIRKKPGCLTFTLEGRDANSDRGNVGDSYKSLEINAFQKPSKSSSAPTPFKKPPIIIGGDDGD
ncbi:hypothetical protein B0I72DRAFT_177305 [Yarrowia lipolytica]|nr:hypothetical protein B0I72DRAFT_177305 [Yarrowia lipolytica]RDW36776.1 hypothetical protein B0I73DRAFT_171610 [Yarrowia lipolytica]RDW43238.1 hypothetical protein B0I74DRAFT_176409 [Yarrowia lipolytica]RDW50024.1 hypothetical protein B0I75DRAFT_160772 [Yarrowia lipolytica]